MAELIAQISGQLFVIALQLGGPVLLTLFLVDIIFGAIGKIAAQVNVHNESQPIKAFIGILVLIPSLLSFSAGRGPPEPDDLEYL